MAPDARSFRVALVADRYVNPPPGGTDGLAAAADAGWGVLQLPARQHVRHVGGRQHREDPGDGPGLRSIDAENPGVRKPAPHRLAPDHSGKDPVRGVSRPAGHLLGPFGPRRGTSNGYKTAHDALLLPVRGGGYGWRRGRSRLRLSLVSSSVMTSAYL